MHIPVYGLEANLLDKESGISLTTSTIYNGSPRHTHNHFEFFIVTNGLALHMINDSVQPIEKGDFFFIRPADVHCYDFYHSENFSIRNLGFSQQIYQNVNLFLNRSARLKEMSQGEFPPKVHLEGDNFEKVMELLSEISRMKGKAHPRHIRYHAQCVIALFLEDYFFHYETDEASDYGPGWLDALLENMQKPENFQEGYKKMCLLAPCSPNHLCRTMKKLYGKTPTQYINEQRLNYSVYLLTQTDLDILDICDTCGFSNLSHFYHLFKKQFGLSPLEYRRSKKLENM